MKRFILVVIIGVAILVNTSSVNAKVSHFLNLMLIKNIQ